MSPLAALVAAAAGSLVLPPGERRAQVDVPEPLRLLDSFDLGAGRHVAAVEDAAGGRWTVPLIVEGDVVRRAVPGDGVAEAVVRGLNIDVRPTFGGAFSVESWHWEDVHGERGLSVDQTNESVVVGERAMVKWAVHLPPGGVRGGQPAGHRLFALDALAFPQTPRPWGLLMWADGEHVEHGLPAHVMLASVTAYLEGAQDGWDWAVDDVSRAARHETTLDEALVAPRRLGALTARLHLGLAAGGGALADRELLARWRDRALAELDEAVEVSGGDEGDRLRILAPRIAAAYDGFLDAVGSLLIDVHGDFHVGQILRTPNPDPAVRFDYAVTDFDGNPVLPPEERGHLQPAALDVVGMLASLDHVGRVVLRRTEGADPDVVRAWIVAAQDGFSYEYRDILARAGRLDLLDERLLRPLRLQQEVREFLYAVRHLPHWVYVPDAALSDLLPDV